VHGESIEAEESLRSRDNRFLLENSGSQLGGFKDVVVHLHV
jgi:hypothetical protein